MPRTYQPSRGTGHDVDPDTLPSPETAGRFRVSPERPLRARAGGRPRRCPRVLGRNVTHARVGEICAAGRNARRLRSGCRFTAVSTALRGYLLSPTPREGEGERFLARIQLPLIKGAKRDGFRPRERLMAGESVARGSTCVVSLSRHLGRRSGRSLKTARRLFSPSA